MEFQSYLSGIVSMKTLRTAFRFIVFLVFTVHAGKCIASECDSPADFAPWTHLRHSGLTWNLDVLSDQSYLATGGLEPGSGASRTLFDSSLEVDLQETFLKRSLRGTLVVGFQGFVGENGNADSGDIITYSNFDNDIQFAQLSALYYQLPLLNDDLRLIVGKHDANELFNFNDVAGDFINSAMGNQPALNEVMPTYPVPATSFNAQARLTQSVTGTLGVYDGRLVAGVDTGSAGLRFSDPYWIVGQLDFALLDDDVSRFSIGAWTHTFDAFDRLDGSGDQNGQDGWYANLDLRLWNRRNREVLFFAGYGGADEKVNPISQSVAIGLVGNGFIENRSTDSIGIGAAWAELSDLDATTDEDAESQIEAYYHAVVGEHWFLQPTLTGIYDVGGDSQVDDALVLSLRVGYSR